MSLPVLSCRACKNQSKACTCAPPTRPRPDPVTTTMFAAPSFVSKNQHALALAQSEWSPLDLYLMKYPERKEKLTVLYHALDCKPVVFLLREHETRLMNAIDKDLSVFISDEISRAAILGAMRELPPSWCACLVDHKEFTDHIVYYEFYADKKSVPSWKIHKARERIQWDVAEELKGKTLPPFTPFS